MSHGAPDRLAFNDAIAGILSLVRIRYPAFRVFGGVTDELWAGGCREAASAIEEFWNSAAQSQSFSLLCACPLDSLDGRAYEGALRHVSNPQLVSRTHFARFLVESGRCANTYEVFRHYLVDGKPGYVPHRWAGLGETVRWISAAGGAAVIAHPARYRFTPTEEYALFTEFVAHGGRGVEVVTGSHSEAEAIRYADTAEEFGLLASRGSDFHDPGESRTDLGALPWLPGRLSPVWEALAARIERR